MRKLFCRLCPYERPRDEPLNSYLGESPTMLMCQVIRPCLPASPFGDQEASVMTAAQLAEAERLVAEWEPNPAEPETNAAQAGN